MHITDITKTSPLLGSEGNRNIIHLLLEGRLDGVTVTEAQAKLEQILKGKKKYTLILDCQDLDYISSVGIRLLFLQARQIREVGGMIKLMNLSHGVKGILDLAGFLPGIAPQGSAIFENIEEADKYLESLVSPENLKPEAPRKTLVLK
jgi:anti-sigma B factor antagonist